ncbi:MAG: DUF58 domain-containing protein [Bacteroidales bacterium]|nr:DUF58 domain-containing protein [Bacteroidales bacterium]NLK81161.1 DUF58 domain-containing protein [Bacteroidales bacterium]
MLETGDLLQRVRKIEIKTKGLSKNIFAGEYHSVFKGRGMAFSEVREYQYGDPIRDIDWNVTARFNKPYVKVFEEERELTVMLLIDMSGSQSLGSRMRTKREYIAEIAAVLSFSAMQNNDKIGVILFSDVVEKFIPPQKGRKHILRVIREILEFSPQSLGTNIPHVLQFFTNAIKRRCTAFLISDFADTTPLYDSLSIANKKHDVMAIRVFDELEYEVPNIGLVRVRDAETGKEMWVNTAQKSVRTKIQEQYTLRMQKLEYTFVRTGVDNIAVQPNKDYVVPLMQLFKKR